MELWLLLIIVNYYFETVTGLINSIILFLNVNVLLYSDLPHWNCDWLPAIIYFALLYDNLDCNYLLSEPNTVVDWPNFTSTNQSIMYKNNFIKSIKNKLIGKWQCQWKWWCGQMYCTHYVRTFLTFCKSWIKTSTVNKYFKKVFYILFQYQLKITYNFS